MDISKLRRSDNHLLKWADRQNVNVVRMGDDQRKESDGTKSGEDDFDWRPSEVYGGWKSAVCATV